MRFFQEWWPRIAAVATVTFASVLVPVAAFASSGTGSVVVEAVRRRPRGYGGSIFGALCCLVVVGAIVVVVLLVMRNRRSGPPR